MKFLLRKLHQSWLVVSLCLGVIFGTVLALIFRVEFFVSPFWVLFVLILFIFAFFKPNYLFLVIIFLSGIVLAFFRTSDDLSGEAFLRQFSGKNITISGKIINDPNVESGSTNLQLENIIIEGVSTKGKVFASLSGKDLKVGRSDILILKGKMSEGFGSFSGAIYRPEIIAISHPEPGDLFLRMRDWFAGRVRKYLPETESALGLAYLLGMKSGLPKDINEMMRIVGLTHIVVASGTHLGIIVSFVKKIFGRLSRFSGLLFSILFILVFGGIIGWTASITRASIVTILSIFAWYVGRKFEPWRILLLTMAITLMIDPMFVTDLGWLLSFASFSGILIFMPKIKNFFFGERKISKITEILLATISAQLICIPILLYFFGSLSLISPIANILILPTIPLAMGFVFFCGLFSFPFIGEILGFISKFILDYHLLVVDFFSKQKMFILQFENNNPIFFLLYVSIILPFVVGFFRAKIRRRKLQKSS